MQAIVAADNNWGIGYQKQTAGEHSIRYEVLSSENNRKCCSYGTKDTGKFPKRTSFEE